ncbi:MAG: hypothetical protein RSA66_10215 [Muribaculaceae bacterium]
MRKIRFKTSNRWKHVLGGVLIGICSDSTYCAVYTSVIAGGCLELKDKLHSNKWDWIDFWLTIAGGSVGRLISIAVCTVL